MKKSTWAALAGIVIISIVALDRCALHRTPQSGPEALIYALYEVIVFGERRPMPEE